MHAERMFELALSVDPNHLDTLNNYAVLLHRKKKDFRGAQEMYQCVQSIKCFIFVLANFHDEPLINNLELNPMIMN